MATASRFLLRQPVGKGGGVVGVVVGGGRLGLGLGLESKQDKTKRTKQQEQDETRLRQDKTRL